MFNRIKPESHRELILLSKKQKHDIRKTRNKKQSTTNKILSNNFSQENNQISSKEKNLSYCYHPKPYHAKTPKIKRNKSSFPTITTTNIGESKCRNMNNDCDVRNYSSILSKTICNKNFLDDRKYDIFKNSNCSRVRKIFAMASDIFNLTDSSVNYNKQKSIDFNSQEKNNCLRSGNNYIPSQKSNKHLSKIRRNKTKENNDNKKSIISNDSKKLLKKNLRIFIENVDSKKFNRSSYLLRKDYNKSDTRPLFTMKRKTNLSNISSVNYNIISSDLNSNINAEYAKYSSIKPEFSNYEYYEIIIPKNFNNTNESKLQNILHSQGLHFFNFKSEGDIVVGEKGKYTFNIRKSNLNNEKNNINKVIKKLEEKYNIKLKKTNRENKKKGSEITMKYGPEKICNHLQKKNNACKFGKKNNNFKYDIKYKNQYLFTIEKAQEQKK